MLCRGDPYQPYRFPPNIELHRGSLSPPPLSPLLIDEEDRTGHAGFQPPRSMGLQGRATPPPQAPAMTNLRFHPHQATEPSPVRPTVLRGVMSRGTRGDAGVSPGSVLNPRLAQAVRCMRCSHGFQWGSLTVSWWLGRASGRTRTIPRRQSAAPRHAGSPFTLLLLGVDKLDLGMVIACLVPWVCRACEQLHHRLPTAPGRSRCRQPRCTATAPIPCEIRLSRRQGCLLKTCRVSVATR